MTAPPRAVYVLPAGGSTGATQVGVAQALLEAGVRPDVDECHRTRIGVVVPHGLGPSTTTHPVMSRRARARAKEVSSPGFGDV